MASEKDPSRRRPLTQVLKDLRHCLDQWSGELYYNAFFGDPTLSQDWEGLYDRTLACETRLSRGLEQLRPPLDEFRHTIRLAHETFEGWAAMVDRLSRLSKHPGSTRALESLKEALDQPEYSMPESMLAQDGRYPGLILDLQEALGLLRRALGPDIAQTRLELEKEAAASVRPLIALEQAEAELAKAKAELHSAASSRAEMAAKLDRADKEILRREEQERGDSELRTKLQREAAQSSRALAASEAQLAAARRQFQEANAAPALLTQQLERVQAELKQAQAESAQLRSSLEEAQARAQEQAKEQLQKTADQEREVREVREESQDLQRHLERGKARIAKLSAELEASFRGEKPSSEL